MQKVLSFVLACLMLAAVMIASVSAETGKKPKEYTMEDVEELMNVKPRDPGVISVLFAKEVPYQKAKSILVGLGFPTDFADKTVYSENTYMYYTTLRVFFDIIVPEEDVASLLLTFLNLDEVELAEPYWTERHELESPTVLPPVGDVNLDGKQDAFDYQMLKAAILGGYTLETDQHWQADVKGDGELNAFDYQLLKYAVMNGFKFS